MYLYENLKILAVLDNQNTPFLGNCPVIYPIGIIHQNYYERKPQGDGFPHNVKILHLNILGTSSFLHQILCYFEIKTGCGIACNTALLVFQIQLVGFTASPCVRAPSTPL
jgi:hypothetical protein